MRADVIGMWMGVSQPYKELGNATDMYSITGLHLPTKKLYAPGGSTAIQEGVCLFCMVCTRMVAHAVSDHVGDSVCGPLSIRL